MAISKEVVESSCVYIDSKVDFISAGTSPFLYNFSIRLGPSPMSKLTGFLSVFAFSAVETGSVYRLRSFCGVSSIFWMSLRLLL